MTRNPASSLIERDEVEIAYPSGSVDPVEPSRRRWMAPQPRATVESYEFGNFTLVVESPPRTATLARDYFLLEVSDLENAEDDLDAAARKLFTRAEQSWTPEARISERFNMNSKKIAEARGEQFNLMSMAQVRAHYVQKKGEDGWARMLRREGEKKTAEIWAQE